MFDIKTHFGIQGVDNDEVEASYATVNRMVQLIGDLPFREYLNGAWSGRETGVIPRILKNLPSENESRAAIVPPLFKGLNDARRGLTTLSDMADMSFRKLIEDGFREERIPIYGTLMALRRLGICLPTLGTVAGCGCFLETTIRALLGLIEKAPDLTYKDLYVKRKSEVSGAAVTAIHRALGCGLLYQLNSRTCCSPDGASCCPGTGNCIPVQPPATGCDIIQSTPCCKPPRHR